METEKKELKCVAVHEEKLTLVQKAGLVMLERRAKRLLRLLELNAPTPILCHDAELIFRAACQLNPEIAGKALACTIRDHFVFEKNLCMLCYDADEYKDGCGMCKKCEEELKEEFEEDEAEDGDEKRDDEV